MTQKDPDLSTVKTLADVEKLYPPRNLPAGAEVVRYAPSPTGLLHLGGAMQGVIDRALATRTNGVFIMRIEDTDRARFRDDALQSFHHGLAWLNLTPDEGVGHGGSYGPYAQSERLSIYHLAANELLEKGHAYRCFCTSERLDLMRKNQQQQGLLPKYDGQCRRLSQETIDRKLAEGTPYVIRMKIPENETIQCHDLIRGPISFDSETLTDEILIKSDGFPTYHLAAMVDDHFMHVTTVVRGEEWISSAPKHMLLWRYFGWEAPKYLHTVLLRDAQKRKLSKRSGDTSVRWFELQGYLPEGFRNFITRVMWAHPEEKDIYSYDEFTKLMRYDHLQATGPVADFALLGFINGKYISEMTSDKLYNVLCDYFDKLLQEGQGLKLEIYNGEQRDTIEYTHDTLKAFSDAMRRDPVYSQRVFALEPERLRRLGDVLDQYSFFFQDLYVPPSVDILLKTAGSAEKARIVLDRFISTYPVSETHDEWESRLRAICDEMGEKPKPVFMTVRLAVSGREKSPPVYDIAQILGADEVKRRAQVTRDRLP